MKLCKNQFFKLNFEAWNFMFSKGSAASKSQH